MALQTGNRALKRVCQTQVTKECREREGRFYTRGQDFSCQACQQARYSDVWERQLTVPRTQTLKAVFKEILDEQEDFLI